MTPVWMFEGTKELDAEGERRAAERRFSALAEAVRHHEASTRRELPGVRAADTALYRRLRQICGDPAERIRVAGTESR
jgi:hypothetical protein